MYSPGLYLDLAVCCLRGEAGRRMNLNAEPRGEQDEVSFPSVRLGPMGGKQAPDRQASPTDTRHGLYLTATVSSDATGVSTGHAG